MRYTTSQKLAALKEGKELPVDPGHMHEPGTYLATDEKLVRDLAIAYQFRDDPDYASVSWENQVKAAKHFNEHGLNDTLDHMLMLERENEESRARRRGT
jgi:hypothetical protein